MGVKSYVGSDHESIDIDKYPYLGVSKYGDIILFTWKEEGIFIHKSENTPNLDELYQYRENWDETAFEPFTGTITLSNKENN